MTKQKSVKGLLIYCLIGIIAMVPLYLGIIDTIDKPGRIRANEGNDGDSQDHLKC